MGTSGLSVGFLTSLREEVMEILQVERSLSPRSIEVLKLMHQGKTSSEIAEILGISRPRASELKSSLRGRMGVLSDAALLRATKHFAQLKDG